MKYIALLRGINVGGNSLVKMSDLKKSFEDLGFKNVMTYINSGNVIFEGNVKNISKLPWKTVVISEKELKEVIDNAPNSWKKDDLRKYVAFLLPPVKPEDVLKEITLKEDVDYIDVGKNVLYMSTKLEGISKSSFKDLIKTVSYKSMTMRNFNTVEKLLKLTS